MFTVALEQLGERATARRHAAKRRPGLDERIAHVIVHRRIRSLDRQTAALRRHDDTALAERRDERLAIAVDLDEHRLRFLRELVDGAGLHESASLKHDDAI